MTSTIIKYGTVAYVSLTVGFYGGYKFKEVDDHWTLTTHHKVCNSNAKYNGHPAYDTDGSRMCFQQSKLTGRIERVSLLVEGL